MATMSSFIPVWRALQSRPPLEHCCTAGREADKHRRVVSRGYVLLHWCTAGDTAGREADEYHRVVGRGGGDKILLHSSGIAIVHGTALVHCCWTREWRALLDRPFEWAKLDIVSLGGTARRGEPGKHCRVVGRGYVLLRGPALCTAALMYCWTRD